jgi:outer membrane lipoprotein-sorting protein
VTILTSPRVRRWLVPCAAAVAVLGGGAAIGMVTAAADRALPPRSASQLLVDLQSAKLDGFSGTVVARVDLGLPPLSSPDGGPDLTSLLSGTHTVRVWFAGPSQARVALLGPQGETDVINNGTDQWIWSSRLNSAVHHTTSGADGKPHAGTGSAPSPFPTVLPSLGQGGGQGAGPEQIAGLALTLLGQTAAVTSSGPTTVAGRDAYELVVSPKDLSSRIGSLRLAIDAQAHIPLRLQVFARGAGTPAVEVGFTQISLTKPDAAEFAFNPPPGTKIVEAPTTGPDAGKDTPNKDGKPAGSGFAVVGSGWTSVLVFRLPAATDGTAASADLDRAFASLPEVSGAFGHGRILAGSLFSVLHTDDGRVLLGAVGPEQLTHAAADPAAALHS